MYKKFKVVIVSLFLFSLLYSQDKLTSNIIDSLGLKQGLWIELEAKPDIIGISHLDLDDGTSYNITKYDYDNYLVLKYKGQYKNGLRTGEWNIYNPNGELRYSITYDNGLVKGDFKLYYPNGAVKLKGYIDRKQRTIVTKYNESGIELEKKEWFTNGLLERLNR